MFYCKVSHEDPRRSELSPLFATPFAALRGVGTLQGVWNDRNDNGRFDLDGPRANGPLGRFADPELSDRMWSQALVLAMLLTVMIGGACLALLAIGFTADPSRYGIAARVVAGIGVPLVAAAGVLAVRARRNRSPRWLVGVVAVELAWAAVLVLTVRA
ncbi:hypothetical protein [Streptomyces sp. KR80]|uniref:hypothetical protein n=1 Tax=Streptomyces sp. KR80 TaxID=3457426 RepID=UPI003FD2FB6E